MPEDSGVYDPAERLAKNLQEHIAEDFKMARKVFREHHYKLAFNHRCASGRRILPRAVSTKVVSEMLPHELATFTTYLEMASPKTLFGSLYGKSWEKTNSTKDFERVLRIAEHRSDLLRDKATGFEDKGDEQDEYDEHHKGMVHRYQNLSAVARDIVGENPFSMTHRGLV